MREVLIAFLHLKINALLMVSENAYETYKKLRGRFSRHWLKNDLRFEILEKIYDFNIIRKSPRKIDF